MKIYVNNKVEEVPQGSNGIDLAKQLHLTSPDQALCININGTALDLSSPLHEGDKVEFISFDSKEGKEIFWHSSAHVLAEAVKRLWPEAEPTIGPSIENGFYYDFANLTISDTDFEKIEKEVAAVIAENEKPVRILFSSKDEAKDTFSHNSFKVELIDGFVDGPITAYKQGTFIDLCRGPHLPNMGKIKAFKVMKTSGAYWRGDAKNQMLTRIYGISFPEKKLLKDYLVLLEEAKKRDHKKLGQQLDLFSFKEEAPGMCFLHPKGMIIWEQLLRFLRETLDKNHYKEIKTPLLLSKDLWVRSGHWSHYRENMYLSNVDDKEYAIKPMNCPGCMLFYKSAIHSYRELPMRISEIGHVHRHEASGALNGLFRVRSFHQDDAHVFMAPDQIKDEILNILTMIDKVYMTFGLSYKLELSTRPEKSKTIGTDEEWENATNGLKGALEAWGHSYHINEGDGAFYGPKIDVHIRDAIGRFWQCATIQLDMSLPEKFDLHYVDWKGEHVRPIMIHRTIYGSIERFLGVLTEHFAGNFPLWMSPLQVRLLTVADRHAEYAHKVESDLKKAGFICDVDDSGESVSKKIRNAQLQKANYILTIGDTEVENQTISLRTRDNVVHGERNFSEFLEKIQEERNNKDLMSPFAKQ